VGSVLVWKDEETMIIVEGADLVGKTTFCTGLLERDYCQENGMVYSHLSRLPPGWDHVRSYIERACRNVVQDRFHMSEPVYARVRGEETKLTPEKYRLVDAYLRTLGAVHVVIVASLESTIARRWREGEMYDLNKVIHANTLFKTMAWPPHSVYRPDVDFVFVAEELTDDAAFSRAINEVLNLHAQRKRLVSRG
jgi:hypothetical protein